MTNQLTRRVGFKGTPKLDPYWMSTRSEIRIESVNKDNSHSWVRIYHGVKKLVTDLITRSTMTTTGDLQRRRKYLLVQAAPRLKQNQEDLQLLARLRGLHLFLIEHGLILNQELNSIKLYPVAKRINTLLRHGELPREKDGAIEFWRLKDDLQNKFEYSQYWSDEKWNSTMARGGGHKKRFQYCTDPSGPEILYLRAPQGHSGRNLIDPSSQDNVLIPNNFFEYIYHI